VQTTCVVIWLTAISHRRSLRSKKPSNSTSALNNLSYPLAFKLEVALLAERRGQSTASRVMGVSRRRIFDWLRQTPRLAALIEEEKASLKKSDGRRRKGRCPRNTEVDGAVHDWFRKWVQEQGKRPRSALVQVKITTLFSYKHSFHCF
jgi:hypothetical protein